ncbi:MAG TPA: Gfo/Idh/MocA family oxidoreductase [Balneolales bacterium]|nr:Gfo/Idh/MocA family oxidoreductase [Balneolales bacterium]
MNLNRKEFLKKISLTVPFLASSPSLLASGLSAKSKRVQILKKRSNVPANDRIQVGSIGLGIMGFKDAKAALHNEGIELVAAADCYDGRLVHAKEVFGDQVKTTRDYREVLDDPSVDAVIIATPDHWHHRVTTDALKKNKPVYCEKPMVHHIDEGHEVIKAHQKYKHPMQVGSQYVSSIVFQKVRDLINQGEIGDLNYVEAYVNRHSALGAWEYSIPTDASKETISWNTFLGDAPKEPFDPVRFFRWRNYRAYGTGIPGDLFVHLFSMLHMVTGSHGPNRIYASGGLRYWKDGREVPDIMMGVYDYPKTDQHPAFNLVLHVNFENGDNNGGMGIRFIGSEGAIHAGYTSLTLAKNKFPKAPGYEGWNSFDTFSKKEQEEFVAAYDKKYGNLKKHMLDPKHMDYQAPEGYTGESMHYDHFANWFDAIRNGVPTVEGPVFGLRAAGPALASNLSYFEKKSIHWNPETMTVKS